MSIGGESGPTTVPIRESGKGAMLFMIGGVATGLAAASCCVIPFLLFLAGIGGVWVAGLTALEPYRLFFAVTSIGCIGYGLYRVYARPATSCAEDSYCTRSTSATIVKIGLWGGAVIIVLALLSPYALAFFL